jgi:hypothetical protein
MGFFVAFIIPLLLFSSLWWVICIYLSTNKSKAQKCVFCGQKSIISKKYNSSLFWILTVLFPIGAIILHFASSDECEKCHNLGE